jgi:hypothetical protein
MSGGSNPLSSATSAIMSAVPGVNAGRQGQGDYQYNTQQLIDRIEKEWQLPAYQQTPLTPQEYSLLNQYAPQVAAFVQQQAPSLLSNIQGPGQQAQQQSLQGLQQLASTGTDEATQALYQSANISADQAMRSNRANALSLLNARGLGSSGASLNADISTGLGAAEQQRQASLQAAAQQSQLKANAISQLGSLGTQVAGQQIGEQEYNANTLNQYNQQLANRLQQYNEYAASTSNQAQQFNQQQAQQVANQNTNTANQFAQYNRSNQINEATNLAQMNNQKVQAVAGIQGGANAQALGAAQQTSQNQTGFFLGALGLGSQGIGKASTNPTAIGPGADTNSPAATSATSGETPNQ